LVTPDKAEALLTLTESRFGDGRVLPSLGDLLTADADDFIARHTDIAAVNLACARGLPNCNESAFPEYLTLLDTIAEAVKKQTEKSWRLFKVKPHEFNHSENVFRIYTMEYVFRALFGIKYDPKVREATATGKPWTTTDSTEICINGILSDKRTGTCSSLPTFAIAVGRRLGYPLKLILVPNHTLYRWDDGKEVFNLQPNVAGGEVKPDAFFYTWPRLWDDTDRRINARTKVWLHPLSPRQEVSKFLCNRALILRDTKRYPEALEAIRAAERFDPINPACADIHLSIELSMVGSRASSRKCETVTPALQGGSFQIFGSMQPAIVGIWVPSPGTSVDSFAPVKPSSGSIAPRRDDKQHAERNFAEEHYRLVNLINESNRNRTPQHPNGNPPTEPLLRQLTKLPQKRKGH
jgi:hypothetical protein